MDPKSTLHLVLKSSRARGQWSLLAKRNKLKVEDTLKKLARQNGIKIYRFINVGNHLHILIQAQRRENFQRFLRLFTGRVAMMITGAKKGNKQGKFWDGLAFTRVVKWGHDFKSMTRYFLKNEIESLGYQTQVAKQLIHQGQVVFESG